MPSNFFKSQTVTGLGAYTIAVPTAGTYEIDGKMTLSTTHASTNPSVVVVTISKTTTGTIYTGVAGARGFHVNQYCAADDVITITLSSAATVDQGKNTIKATISISEAV